MEFEAVDEGTVTKILVPEGTDGVKVRSADRNPGRRRREDASDCGSAPRKRILRHLRLHRRRLQRRRPTQIPRPIYRRARPRRRPRAPARKPARLRRSRVRKATASRRRRSHGGLQRHKRSTSGRSEEVVPAGASFAPTSILQQAGLRPPLQSQRRRRPEPRNRPQRAGVAPRHARPNRTGDPARNGQAVEYA